MPAQKHIIVVGAGIVGASIAWHLTKAGARVTMVAASGPGGVATPSSFAWINASWGNPKPYFDLRLRSMAEWTRLKAGVPEIPLRRNGALCWDLPRAELEAFAAEHASWGYGIRRVDRAETARIEPALAELPELALHVAEEGAAEPVASTLALLADAERLGARIMIAAPVKSLVLGNDRIAGVDLDEGRLEADDVVLAAGAGSPALLATVGVALPIDTPPGLLVHSKPHRHLLNGLVIGEKAHVRQTTEGRIVAGADFGGTEPGTNPEETARELFAEVRSMLVGADDLKLDFHTVGYRPTPADGFPAIGRAPGLGSLYIAVMHSGITLAPAIGRMAADEILSGRRDPLLLPYGIDRFA
ncbi:FAD-binding oxidoreductase [Mesorhizobium sp. KR9-304]|uniref:NAD(P)/FAD-dependent oxidoreductase n=1 Tax=Mesorhizobium sp. KR9-304 TaxID=3156614 RepID=UPI0032B6070D